MNIDRTRLGEVIRSLREQKGLSRRDLAESVGLSQHAIRYIEQGRAVAFDGQHQLNCRSAWSPGWCSCTSWIAV